MLEVSERLRELRAHYCNALVAMANEVGSVDASVEGAVALSRVRRCLGEESEATPPAGVDEQLVKARVTEYVISLKGVLRSFRPMDHGDENQQVLAQLEKDLGGLI